MHIGPLRLPPLREEQIYSFKRTSLARKWGRSLNSHRQANMTTSFIFSRMEVRVQGGLGGKYHRSLQPPPPGLPADCRTALGARPQKLQSGLPWTASSAPPIVWRTPCSRSSPRVQLHVAAPLILLPCPRLRAVMSSGDRAARCVRGG